jgi:hypothetical protein
MAESKKEQADQTDTSISYNGDCPSRGDINWKEALMATDQINSEFKAEETLTDQIGKEKSKIIQQRKSSRRDCETNPVSLINETS